MLKWMGLFALSSVLKRKVSWPKSLLGGYDIYPNLYVVLVGEPAVVRKSTTFGFPIELLNEEDVQKVAQITWAGDVTSHSKILANLETSPDGSLVIASSEFSSLVQTTPEATYEILTDLYDNKKKLDWKTWAHGDKRVENPVIILGAATTPAWLQTQPKAHFVGGGFASRILFLYEEKPRQKEIYYDHIDANKIEELRTSLVTDLAHISKQHGTFRHESKATKEYYREWYKSLETETTDDRLKGYYGRKHVHAHKIVILLSLAERDDLKATKAHLDEAIQMLDYIETKMSRAFSSLGMNPHAVLMDEVLEYVALKGKTTLKQIAVRFYRDGATLEQLKSCLSFLCVAGKLKAIGTSELALTYSIVKEV